MPHDIIMNSVESSNIEKIGYNEHTRILEVQFKNGKRYRYSGVPVDIFKSLRESPSKGHFLSAHIKKFYECINVPEKPVDVGEIIT